MSWMQVLKTLAALTGILGLILGLAYFIRRFNLGGATGEGNGAGLRVLAVKMLGPKRQIYILEVGTRLLLIGATDRTMTALMEIQDPNEREAILEAVSKKSRTLPSFRDFLKRAQS